MPQRDRAAIDIDALHVGVQLALPRQHDRRESLVDLEQIDVVDRQSRARQNLLCRGIGPVSIITGSTPTTCCATKRARGVSPSSSAFSGDVTAAPPRRR